MSRIVRSILMTRLDIDLMMDAKIMVATLERAVPRSVAQVIHLPRLVAMGNLTMKIPMIFLAVMIVIVTQTTIMLQTFPVLGYIPETGMTSPLEPMELMHCVLYQHRLLNVTMPMHLLTWDRVL